MSFLLNVVMPSGSNLNAVMITIIICSAVMPSITEMSFVMLSIIMLNILILSVSIQSVIILSDIAPFFNFLQKLHKRPGATKRQM